VDEAAQTALARQMSPLQEQKAGHSASVIRRKPLAERTQPECMLNQNTLAVSSLFSQLFRLTSEMGADANRARPQPSGLDGEILYQRPARFRSGVRHSSPSSHRLLI
jgi:hypothetical protein